MRYNSLLDEFLDIHYDHPAPVHDIEPAFIVDRLKKPTGKVAAVLDTDAYTGGFNLQIAWATGRLAGQSAATEKE